MTVWGKINPEVDILEGDDIKGSSVETGHHHGQLIGFPSTVSEVYYLHTYEAVKSINLQNEPVPLAVIYPGFLPNSVWV